MTTQDIENALVALPSSDELAEDMRAAGYTENAIRAVVVVIDHARPVLGALLAVERVPGPPR